MHRRNISRWSLEEKVKDQSPQSSPLPCPFCGKDRADVKKRETGFYCVRCAFCAAETGATYTIPEAIASWNRRINEGPKRDAAFEAMVGALDLAEECLSGHASACSDCLGVAIACRAALKLARRTK